MLAAGAKGMTMYKLICCVAVAVAGLGGQAVAVIINVPGDQPTIQAGIVAAVDGDEVVVAVGTYNEAIDFLGKEITVRSTDPTDPAVVAATIIDPPTGLTAVTINNSLADTVFSGFTVTGAENDTDGVGMRVIDGILGPLVTNCVFTNNTGTLLARGGGIFCQNCVFSPVITNCTFSGNVTADNGNGAGLFSLNSSVIVSNSVFESNISGGRGGGIFLDGIGPLFNPPEVTDCSFTQNSAPFSQGGGIHSINNDSVITNCTFTNNTAGTGGGYWSNSIVLPPITQLVGCTFIGNVVTGSGGAVRVNRSEIIDCTFTDNSASQEGGAIQSLQELNGTGLQFCGNLPDTIDAGDRTNLDIVCNPCPPDIDGDGIVGVPDLLTLLAAWGPCQ